MNNNFPLIDNSLDLLENMYDDVNQLFSYSTKLQGSKFVNDFFNIGKYRYTINVLLGLAKIKNQNRWNLELLSNNYYNKYYKIDTNIGNRGLFLKLLSLLDLDIANSVFYDLVCYISNKNLNNLNIQEISWLLLGFNEYCYKNSNNNAKKITRKIAHKIVNDYLNGTTLIPKHNHTIRGNFVSFGGIVYYLMSLYEFANNYNDNYFLSIFRESVSQIIRLQCKDGAWPWFIDSTSGKVMDWYQIYSVHQDSMAMLFLLPAYDLDINGSEEAIVKSYKYLFGENHLNEKMIITDPFFIYRSFKKNKIFEKPVRLISSIVRKVSRLENKNPTDNSISLNKECRSYHLGWILYAWHNRNDFREFTELKL